MHDQSARLHLGQECVHVEVGDRLHVARGAIGRAAQALQLVNASICSFVAVGINEAVKSYGTPDYRRPSYA